MAAASATASDSEEDSEAEDPHDDRAGVGEVSGAGRSHQAFPPFPLPFPLPLPLPPFGPEAAFACGAGLVQVDPGCSLDKHLLHWCAPRSHPPWLGVPWQAPS
jgi:hypothetical protein